ncbi:MAG: zinc carboxypeptidase [Cyclobacteriaceae bacterium]|nr:zinc carboxypeptidase [Cyclobacteriaceae bacterium HetDA_MAG_MS6]
MDRRMAFLVYFSLLTVASWAQVKSPAKFLGYELGDQFTRYHQVVDYFEHVANESSQVQLIQYGKTYEDRPLLLAFVASQDNINRLDQIREDNLRRAGLLAGEPTTDVALVWLSYNVHGNESVSTEASMATLYELISDGSDKAGWLENTVVIIDPCINPDGRERYVNFYWQYGNQPYTSDPNSMEHREPWPSGRPNHYLFDLNRDWAWQTQIETQHRMAVYNQWLPHIHVDFHEQGINSPYYFAPAAEPFHELITDWQRRFQTMIGNNHARYFDEKGWFYFTKEVFDLLYPSYGDTYPTYNGAIGMTYEQGGSGRAGLGVTNQEGDTLTLSDRIAHHYITGLSTIEITAKHSKKVLDEFEQFYKTRPNSKFKSYVLKFGGEDKMSELMLWLDKNGVQYGTASNAKGLKGYHYGSKRTREFTIGPKDLVITTDQPKSVLVQVLFEPETRLADSLTYDITAWAVPYAWNVEAFATTEALDVRPSSQVIFKENDLPETTYAFALDWRDFSDAQFLSTLLKEDVKVRIAGQDFRVGSNEMGAGSILISRRDNAALGEDFEEMIVTLANDHQQELVVLQSGLVNRGPDVGSNQISYLKKPKVALIGGQGSSSLSFGAAWHFMEQDLGYPVTTLEISYLKNVDLSSYDVLIMPNGGYSDFDEDLALKITRWVSDGGKLIAIGSALEKWIDTDHSSLSRYNSDDEKKEYEKRKSTIKEDRKLIAFGDQSREFMKDYIPGAVFQVAMDHTHPLAYGYKKTYYSLKTRANRYAYLPNQNVGVIRSAEDHLSGFAGQYVMESVEKSLVFGVESKGHGQMVYFVDDPLFRSFWRGGKLLVANAIFLVGQ